MAKIKISWWKWIFLFPFILLSIAGTMFGLYFGFNIYKTDIDPAIYYTPKLTTQILDSKNRLIANMFEDEHRLYVNFEDIPSRVVEAIVAIEDTTFFEHYGINVEAILRAAYKVALAGKAVEGASTITQQLVKNLILSREKSIERKAKEAILAIKLETKLSKEEILERYLNEIYFGHGYYGIKTASLGYFRKELKDLTLKEIAILVGLPRAPSFYDPTKHKLHALARANIVIGRMYTLGWINDDEYDIAINEDPMVYKDTRTKNKAPYVVDYVTSLLQNEYPDFKSGGYIVKTTIDLDAQMIAKEAIKNGYETNYKRISTFIAKEDKEKQQEYANQLRQYNYLKSDLTYQLRVFDDGGENRFFKDVNISEKVISIDRELGFYSSETNSSEYFEYVQIDENTTVTRLEYYHQRILEDLNISAPKEYVQLDENTSNMRLDQLNGALVSMKQNTGEVIALVGGVDYEKSNYNRAVQSQRQLGSSFKPFLYLASFDLGYSPSSLIPDISRTYKFKIDENNERIWKPANYEEDFVGMMTEREAVVKSRNLATINLVTGVGLKPIYEKLFDYKFTGLPRDLSISLGSHVMSPLDLSKYYSLITNYGEQVTPRVLRSIQDRFLQVREFETKRERVTKPEQAYLMIDVLKDNVKRGTGRRARMRGIEVGGKTGTTNDNKDGWFCGFTPALQTIVWFGNDNFQQMGDKETGGKLSAPTFKEFNERYLKLHPEMKRKFDKPEGVYEIKLSNGKTEIFTDISKPPKQKRVIEKEEILF